MAALPRCLTMKARQPSRKPVHNHDRKATTIALVRDVASADLASAAWATRVGRSSEGKALFSMAELADRPPLLVMALSTLGAAVRENDPKLKRTGLRMLACLALATIAAQAGKRLVARSRPDRLVDRGEHRIGLLGPQGEDWNAFPSGHTAAAVAMAQAVARDYPDRQAPALTAALTAGVMKIFRGHHFPSDVAVGALLGLAVERIVGLLLPADSPAGSNGRDRAI